MSQHRDNVHRLFNPYATSYGEKIHLVKNEKLTRFVITHIAAVDGYSRKIAGFITIPLKNAIAVCDVLFRPLLMVFGSRLELTMGESLL